MLLQKDISGATHDAKLAIAAAISRELHHAAQPLTVLQGTVEIALLKGQSEEAYRSVLQRVMEHSQKLSNCFNRVQQLAHFQAPAMDISDFSATAMVRGVLENVRGQFIGIGAALDFHPIPGADESGQDVVRSSEKRGAAALEVILSDLATTVQQQGKVELSMDIEPQTIVVRIESPVAAQRTDLSAGLLLAEAIITSAHGTLTWKQQASSILIGLPKAPSVLLLHHAEAVGYVHV